MAEQYDTLVYLALKLGSGA